MSYLITYTDVNGYLIPNLAYKSGEQMEQLGKYRNVKKVVNDAIISLNWGIGKRLSVELTGNNKPEYGKKVVAEVLKLGEFEPQDKGQVELYLRWLEKNERVEGEGVEIKCRMCIVLHLDCEEFSI